MSKNKFSPEIIGKALEITVKEQITENVLVSYNSTTNNYRIQIWKDGVSAGAVIHGIKKWNAMIKLFEDYCINLKKAANALNSSQCARFLGYDVRVRRNNQLKKCSDGVICYL